MCLESHVCVVCIHTHTHTQHCGRSCALFHTITSKSVTIYNSPGHTEYSRAAANRRTGVPHTDHTRLSVGTSAAVTWESWPTENRQPLAEGQISCICSLPWMAPIAQVLTPLAKPYGPTWARGKHWKSRRPWNHAKNLLWLSFFKICGEAAAARGSWDCSSTSRRLWPRENNYSLISSSVNMFSIMQKAVAINILPIYDSFCF